MSWGDPSPISGPQGPEGTPAGIFYEFSSSTTNSNPGTGRLRFDSSSLAGVTTIRASETDQRGENVSGYLDFWDDDFVNNPIFIGALLITKVSNPSNYILCQLNGTSTDQGVWRNVPVTAMIVNGSFSNGDLLLVDFYQNGVKDESIDTGHLKANAVTAGKLDADLALATRLLAGSIEAQDLSVVDLAAISADLGHVTAGTITGVVFRTASSGARTQIDADEGFRQFASDGSTVLTHIPADGSDAQFTGVVRAMGVTLPSGDADNILDLNRLAWEKGLARVGYIGMAADFEEDEQLVIYTEPNSTGDSSQITLHAGGNGGAQLYLLSSPSLREVSVGADGAPNRTLLDSLSRSDFLQLANRANRKVNFGTTTLTWSGGVYAAEKSINHGLGKTPVAVVATQQTFGVGNMVPRTFGFTSSKFSLDAYHFAATPISGTETFCWIAIG